MVKGINKTVIEVNDTGSEMFDRIVFYVSPKYGNLSMSVLQKALCELNLNYKPYAPLRKRVRLHKKRVALLVLGVFLIAATIFLIL